MNQDNIISDIVKTSKDILDKSPLNISTTLANLEKYLCDFDSTTIAHLVEVVQDSIANNHQRLMGISIAQTSDPINILKIKKDIMVESQYLSGTILPMLFDKLDQLDTSSY